MRITAGSLLAAAALAQTPRPSDLSLEIAGGGTCFLYPTAMSLDHAENIYIAGHASQCLDSRARIGPGGGTDLFVIKVAAGGQRIVYSVLIGGTADEQLGGMSVDAEGQMWLAAQTGSRDLPGVPPPAPLIAFAAKLSPAGDRLTAVVPIGGASTVPYAVLTGRHGEWYVAGRTSTRELSATPGAVGSAASPPDTIRGFVIKFDTLGQQLWRALVGGSGADEVTGLAAGPNGEILMVGPARSADFPTTSDAWLQAGSSHRPPSFVAALSEDGSLLLYSTLIDGTDQLGHVRADASGNVYAATGSGPSIC